MKTILHKSSSMFRPGVVSHGMLAVAGGLLFGVMVMGYGYFHQNKIGLYVGLAVIVAGVLNGIVQILIHDNRQ